MHSKVHPNKEALEQMQRAGRGWEKKELLKMESNEKIFSLLSHVWLFATPWTVAYQAPPSMGFSKQEYWSGLPFPFPGDLPDPRIEPRSPALQSGTFNLWATREDKVHPNKEALERMQRAGRGWEKKEVLKMESNEKIFFPLPDNKI